ncbi:putative nuclear membrane protein XMAN1 [Operophtera brumata]|uniref:Putative nuclear membrane protein XMAN1 n=1 Tax=Operophtera brumata TaxID=104452 RepID=A0A0L7LS27_OPEBR|nr:putative nuclear membrane protein XMAN1 [Operophtera brumata]
MADLEVDSMSDAELRRSLAEHGFPIMPITASTKKTLVKKLKLVLSEKGKSRNSVDARGDARPSFARTSDVSSADQVDSMSDSELQAKLSEHGFPGMPVTASTRSLLVKKLKGILEKGTSRNSVGVDSKLEHRHSLQRYSSGEESDLDTKAKEKRGRRQTRGGAMLPPVESKTRRTTKKRSPSPVKMDTDKRDSESDEEKAPIRTREEVETVTTRRITRTFKGNEDDCETGSDSDVDMEKKSTSFRSNSRSSDYISSTFPTVDPSPNHSPIKPSRLTRPSTSPTSPSSFAAGRSSSDNLNSIRSRLGLTSTLGDRPSFYTSAYTPSTYQPSGFQPSTSTIDEVESPYLSNFTRRLSALKTESTPKSTSFLDRDTTNGSTMLPRRSYISGVTRSEEYKATSDKKFLKNNLVSFALLALVGLFFFFLFFIYIVKKNDILSVTDDTKSVIPICQLNIPGNRPGVNCVPKEQVSYAKDLLKVIHPELTARIAAYKCGKPNTMPYLTEREILDIATARADSTDISQCRTDLNNLQVLIVNNPGWGLGVVQLKNLYTRDAEFSSISSTDLFIQQRTKGSIAITLNDPSTPFSCLFVNTLYSAGSTIIVIALLTLLALGAQKGYKLYLEYRKRKSEEIYSMVEQIIDLVNQETVDSGESYISIDHVRDTLISAQNREKMVSTWDSAVKFIQRNESRVRMEVQSVDGEDCRVWRWLAPHASPKRGASWQGQAFETQEGSVNNVPEAPTPCLKIRHMFDKNDTNPNLRSVLQEAILEKCGRCNILHIDLDHVSYCVYVKCASPSDASVVYRSMHGWWYEGKLITVKYLRLERYMTRFPNSPSVGPYLQPNPRLVRE